MTQEQLKEALHYNPETGVFTWTSDRNNRTKKGSTAGSKDVKGYIKIRLQGKTYRAHRLAFLYVTGKFPKDQVDHINHERDDNKWCNLREVTNAENHRNQRLDKRNISGTTGVTLNKKEGKWRVRIQVRGRELLLGNFHKMEDAIKARHEANIKYGYHENHGRESTLTT